MRLRACLSPALSLVNPWIDHGGPPSRPREAVSLGGFVLRGFVVEFTEEIDEPSKPTTERRRSGFPFDERTSDAVVFFSYQTLDGVFQSDVW